MNKKLLIMPAILAMFGCGKDGEKSSINKSNVSRTLPQTLGPIVFKKTVLRKKKEEPNLRWFITTPWIELGNKAVGINNNHVVMMNLETFSRMWVAPLSDKYDPLQIKKIPNLNQSESGLVVGYNGNIFATHSGGALTCFDSKGQRLWDVQMNAPARGDPILSGSIVLIQTVDDGLEARSQENGRILWRHCSEGKGTLQVLSKTKPAVSAGIAVIGYSSGELFGLQELTGEPIWTLNLAPESRRVRNFLETVSDICAQPVVYNGIVYAVTYAGRLVAASLKTGEVFWEKKDVHGYQAPVLQGGRLAFLDRHGTLVCCDALTGVCKWRTNLGTSTSFGPTVLNGYFAVVLNGTSVAFFDVQTGCCVKEWSVATGKERLISVPIPVGHNALLSLKDALCLAVLP